MPNTNNIKTEDLCARCRYGFYNNCFVRDAPCAKCPRYDPGAPSDGWRNVKTCQCMQIREGDTCPYFEEAVKDVKM